MGREQHESAARVARESAVQASEFPQYLLFFLGGAFLSNIGMWMQVVAQGWLVAELTPAPFWNGFVGFCAGAPMLFFSLPGGALADRLDRRKVLLWSQLALMLFSGALAALTLWGLVTVWQVALISFLAGTAAAISQPAYYGFLYDAVGPSQVRRAVSINAGQFHLSRMIGPALAGICLGWIGAGGCFAVNSLSYLAVIPLIIWLPTLVKQDLLSARQESWLGSVREVWGYLNRAPEIRLSLLCTAMVSVLIMPHITLLPVYLKTVVLTGPKTLGWMWVASGMGSVTATVLFERLHARYFQNHTRVILLSALAASLLLAVFSGSRRFFPWRR